MADWVWFGSLAFPAFFRVAVYGALLWFLLRYGYLHLPLEKWFWHQGLVEVGSLILCITLVCFLLTRL
ncbi:hypothetical protein [Parendozoicomonas haliclonae]|uniref:hypothetical protein n=1 Tax=Parendozoicomonas haliclonae TaxID=1960125 RepID=UPI000B3522D0|nr:hypothetical protein [Parendozoicomonas haliclonae]